MLTVLIFLIVIAVLILSHELGHFLFAKARNIRVDEFGFGFPPRLLGKKFGETTYSLNLLPFGGFVKIWGEDEIEKTSDPRNFSSRSIRDRFWIIFAGVLFNMILAYLLFTFGHVLGLPTLVNGASPERVRDVQVQVIEIAPGSPADGAGVRAGDRILRLEDGENFLIVEEVEEVQVFINERRGREIILTVMFGEEGMRSIILVPRENPPAGEGAVGIAMVKSGIVSVPWYQAPWEGLKTTVETTIATARGLALFFGNLVRGTFIGDVAGPIGIARIAGDAHALGFIYLLQLTAVLSINLALLNILPIPALDGGRILFLIIEKIRGTPVSPRVSQMVHAAGFVALIFLMLIITYRDIVKVL